VQQDVRRGISIYLGILIKKSFLGFKHWERWPVSVQGWRTMDHHIHRYNSLQVLWSTRSHFNRSLFIRGYKTRYKLIIKLRYLDFTCSHCKFSGNSCKRYHSPNSLRRITRPEFLPKFTSLDWIHTSANISYVSSMKFCQWK
jgi:hypothetical protein